MEGKSRRQIEATTSLMLPQGLVDTSTFSDLFISIHAPSNSGPTSLPSRVLPSGKIDHRSLAKRTMPPFGYLRLGLQKCTASAARSPKRDRAARRPSVYRLVRRGCPALRLRPLSGRDGQHCKIHQPPGRQYLQVESSAPLRTKLAHRHPKRRLECM